MSKHTTAYGGQAVLEGVMFGGKHVNVTAVRRKNNDITFFEVPKQDKPWIQKLKKIPFLRGIVGLLDSAVQGTQHLNFSAEAFAEDESDDPEAFAKEKEKSSKFDLTLIVGVTVAGILSFLVGKVLFTVIPVVIEDFVFRDSFNSLILHNLLEGVIKIGILLLYLWLITLTPPIKRLFQYHGAEHKVISCYEAGEELTVSNVQKYSTLHYRCGSSFIIFTVIIGVVIYSFFSWDNLWERVIQRLILLPLVIGVSYEVLKFTNSLRDLPMLRYLGYPGLWLQKLTTKQPTDEQVEVSIASFMRMKELDLAQVSKSNLS